MLYKSLHRRILTILATLLFASASDYARAENLHAHYRRIDNPAVVDSCGGDHVAALANAGTGEAGNHSHTSSKAYPALEREAISTSTKIGDSWLSDNRLLDRLLSSNMGPVECRNAWNILWFWAKAGNPEALTKLFLALSPPFEAAPIVPPGFNGDDVSRIRNTIVVGIHSFVVSDERVKGNVLLPFLVEQLSPFYHGPAVIDCLKNRNENCGQLAVNLGLIPTFSEFSDSIDALQSAGFSPHCSSNHNHKRRNTWEKER